MSRAKSPLLIRCDTQCSMTRFRMISDSDSFSPVKQVLSIFASDSRLKEPDESLSNIWRRHRVPSGCWKTRHNFPPSQPPRGLDAQYSQYIDALESVQVDADHAARRARCQGRSLCAEVDDRHKRRFDLTDDVRAHLDRPASHGQVWKFSAPLAYLVISLVGLFFIDFANTLVVTGFVHWMK